MIEGEGWTNESELTIPAINKIILKVIAVHSKHLLAADMNSIQFSLLVIARCGFGMPTLWDPPPKPGNRLTFGESLRIASESIIPRLMLPTWAFRLPIKAYVTPQHLPM